MIPFFIHAMAEDNILEYLRKKSGLSQGMNILASFIYLARPYGSISFNYVALAMR